jgi:hypothetical protein
MNQRQQAIRQAQIDYVNNSGITVETVPIYGHVTIKDNDGNEIFLQGHEGSNFISESRRAWNDMGDITQSEADELTAYPYADALGEV